MAHMELLVPAGDRGKSFGDLGFKCPNWSKAQYAPISPKVLGIRAWFGGPPT